MIFWFPLSPTLLPPFKSLMYISILDTYEIANVYFSLYIKFWFAVMHIKTQH